MRVCGPLLALLIGVAGCGSADFWYFETNNLSGGPTILIVRWSDSALDGAERVVVTLDRLELLGPEGEVLLLEERRSFDLLTLRHGLFAELVAATVPAGPYSGLRFHFAPEGAAHHFVEVGGVEHPLVLATPMPAGFDLRYAIDLPEDAETTVHVDFNVRLSVTEAGGEWYLQPHLSALDPAGAGALFGEVRGGGGVLAGATVSAQRRDAQGASTEILSTASRVDGTFRLGPLAPGRYTLVATAAGHGAASIADVAVSAGVDGGPHLLFLDAASSGAVVGTVPASATGLVVHVLGPAGLIAVAGVDPLSGAFTVPTLATGTYTFQLRDVRGPIETRTNVLVAAGGTTNVAF